MLRSDGCLGSALGVYDEERAANNAPVLGFATVSNREAHQRFTLKGVYLLGTWQCLFVTPSLFQRAGLAPTTTHLSSR